MKKTKTDLRQDSVESDTIHVGIELELIAPCEDSGHDDDACRDAAADNQREYLSSLSTEGLLREYLNLIGEDALQIAPYFDASAWIDNYMDSWSWDGCDDGSGCPYRTSGGREELETGLRSLTGNRSFKVVEDGSINHDDGESDAEVCWNYFVSKETVADNKRILEYLKGEGCRFNTSCGLHINLNNYLGICASQAIPTMAFAPLFNFVAPSRASSSYCTRNAISRSEKYSMLYEQGDRVEFRFFSPTFEADKLNHYVRLAHTIYKRLAGKPAKLPKKTADYFLKKMTAVNGHSPETASAAISFVNTLPAYSALAEKYANAAGDTGREE